MRQLFLVMLLTFVSTSAMAEWTMVGDNVNTNLYIDFSSIKKTGNKVKAWSMDDYKKIQDADKDKYLSDVAQNEYDCKEETTRLLALIIYSENMAKGHVVYSNLNVHGEAAPIPPNSSGRILWKRACGKK